MTPVKWIVGIAAAVVLLAMSLLLRDDGEVTPEGESAVGRTERTDDAVELPEPAAAAAPDPVPAESPGERETLSVDGRSVVRVPTRRVEGLVVRADQRRLASQI